MPIHQPTKIPFTRAAYEKMQSELERLTQERVEVMKRLQTAREMGDLSENGAYQYAKFELGNIGRQLRQLNHLLKNGHIVERTQVSGHIEFGATVTLELNGKQVIYTIVSQHESNPLQGKISTDSPLGQALVGKHVGDHVTVMAPAGPINYTIITIA